jgi:hypothetical protein
VTAPDIKRGATAPLVSVILPTFNRARFLPAAFAAIHAQQIASCEVVVVDDGSTDDTKDVVAAIATSSPLAVRYLAQANQGAYGARNTGVAAAAGSYLAFYDSDDVWLPHHLPTCVAALDDNPDLDWVYGACQLVDLDTGRVISPDSFREGDRPRPFMRLPQDVRGNVHVIVGPGAIRCQIDHGLYCGLQNSVLRSRVFEHQRFATDLRNEAEDQLFAIRSLAAGFRLGFVDAVHVRYQVHGENSSGSAKGASVDKQRRVYEPLIEGYRRLAEEIPLTPGERRALNRRIGRELFWHLGYQVFWSAGHRQEALRVFGDALRAWPWDIRQWKTYALSTIRTRLEGGRRGSTFSGSES